MVCFWLCIYWLFVVSWFVGLFIGCVLVCADLRVVLLVCFGVLFISFCSFSLCGCVAALLNLRFDCCLLLVV